MKKLIFTLCMISLYSVQSQNEWNSISNSTDPMYRKGNVAIGTSGTVTTIPFVVHNTTASTGTKVLFGGTSFVGTPTASTSLLQIRSASASSIDLKGSVTSTKNASATLTLTSTGLELNYSQTGYTNLPFIIKGNGTDRLRIDPSGAVGIGTGSSSLGTCKLAVDGIIGCRELKVTLATTWPDYVFEKEYKRMSFAELDTYLKENKHLPYLPSVKSIQCDNESTFNIGETQVGMLRSIEELYLYVLDLKKENDILKKEIEQLKKSN